MICLVSTLIMDHDVFAVNRFFNLFSSFPLLGGYINQLCLIEDQAMRLKLMIHIVKERLLHLQLNTSC
ncbi:hypothetical protein [Escherichia phage pEC-N1203-2Af.1]|nr:hypothetical protein [Escherichia phage pEC-N1203-2Af.1]